VIDLSSLSLRYYTQVRLTRAQNKPDGKVDTADQSVAHPLKVGDALNLGNTIILGFEKLSPGSTKVFIIDEIVEEKSNTDYKS